MTWGMGGMAGWPLGTNAGADARGTNSFDAALSLVSFFTGASTAVAAAAPAPASVATTGAGAAATSAAGAAGTSTAASLIVGPPVTDVEALCSRSENNLRSGLRCK